MNLHKLLVNDNDSSAFDLEDQNLFLDELKHRQQPLKKKELRLISGIFCEKQDNIYHLLENLK